MPVHIYGQLSDMKIINNIAKKYKLIVIEDCSQSHGSKFLLKNSFKKNLSVFSLYPTKNLGALGDAGIICTNNFKEYLKIKSLREYGWVNKISTDIRGVNSRLDEIQASFLIYKLKLFNKDFQRRQNLAKKYFNLIKNLKVELPKIRDKTIHAFHLFVVQVKERSKFIKFLRRKNIETSIHYSKPLHKHIAFKNILKFDDLKNTNILNKKIVSLPLNTNLSNSDILKISKTINEFK